jgi:hypothetical protein
MTASPPETMGIDSRNASTVSRAVDDFSAGFPQVMLELPAAGNVHLAERRRDYRMSGVELKLILDADGVACPACGAPVTFSRTSTPRIDACGFESYSFECHECGARLAGIIDPLDDELLLSELDG